MPRGTFSSKFVSKLDSLDQGSINSYIHLLAKEHGFLESVFNSIREGVIVLDETFHLVYYNAVAKDFFGIPEDVSRIRISRLIHGINWENFFHFDGKESRTAYHEIEIFYPKRRVLNFYAVPKTSGDMEGSAGFATLIFNDITETYDRLSNTAKNERMQLITMLAAEVAHEIGNPLNSLYLNLQVLLRLLGGGSVDPAEAKSMLEDSKKEVERLDHIIHQFLQAVRPAKPNLYPLDLKNVVLDSLKFMQHEIEGRSITVNCLWSETLPKIRGDADQLKQAFYNLIKNAVQAMTQGGTLTISCSSDSDFVYLDLADQGFGISQENAPKLFSPFFTTKSSGNGIGLMVVERVVREHGGRLSFESMPGKGTTFRLTFPCMNARVHILPGPSGSADTLPESGKVPEKE